MKLAAPWTVRSPNMAQALFASAPQTFASPVAGLRKNS
ncbi:hypothetical protein NPIL_314281, partial [Nephila pilipes]